MFIFRKAGGFSLWGAQLYPRRCSIVDLLKDGNRLHLRRLSKKEQTGSLNRSLTHAGVECSRIEIRLMQGRLVASSTQGRLDPISKLGIYGARAFSSLIIDTCKWMTRTRSLASWCLWTDEYSATKVGYLYTADGHSISGLHNSQNKFHLYGWRAQNKLQGVLPIETELDAVWISVKWPVN